MSLLLSNDDGIHAPGLDALYQLLKQDWDLMVIAPDRDKSGVSSCLTLDRPLQATQLGTDRFAVDGTPTDCIHLGTAGIFMPTPERVLSGINFGANLGDDVLYSGTVAAAMEGRFLPKPSLAISLVVTDYSQVNINRFRLAANITKYLLKIIDQMSFPSRTVLNINIPDLPASQIKGVRMTNLGQRLKGENPISTRNPRGKTLYWIGRAGGPVESKPGSDFHAVENGYVSITPIYADMTNHSVLAMSVPLFSTLTNTFDARTFSEKVEF